MSIPGKRVLTAEQVAGYEELGFVHSWSRSLNARGGPVLSCNHVEKDVVGGFRRTCHCWPMDCTCSFSWSLGSGHASSAYWTAWKICSARSSSSDTTRIFCNKYPQ